MTPDEIREWAAEIRQERDYGDTADRLDAIAARIAELEAALRFYATRKNWESEWPETETEEIEDYISAVEADGGRIARRALTTGDETGNG